LQRKPIRSEKKVCFCSCFFDFLCEQKQRTRAYCGHLSRSSESRTVLTIPLNDTSEFPISNDKIFEWVPLYPGIDVRQELRAYKAWAINNPKQRKTRSGILRSINFWLGNAQNKTRSMGGERSSGFTASTAGPATIRQRRSDDAIDTELMDYPAIRPLLAAR
jgi:hypothetical protein